MELTLSIIKYIQTMAARSPFQEICGLIDSTCEVYPVGNSSPSPGNSFSMHKGDYAEALGDIYKKGRTLSWLYHSHTAGTSEPSGADLANFKSGFVNWLIVTQTDYFKLRK